MTWICLNMLHILRVTLLVIHRLSWQLHCIQWMLQFPWMLYLTILSVKQYVHPYLLNFRLQKVSVYWVEALNSLHFQIDNTHIIVEAFLRQSVNMFRRYLSSNAGATDSPWWVFHLQSSRRGREEAARVLMSRRRLLRQGVPGGMGIFSSKCAGGGVAF